MTDGAPGDIDVAKYERKRSIGPLVFALGTPDRDAAAAALARLRDPRSVKRIVDKVFTAPGDAAMSHAATVALHGLGDEALEPLIELASDHSLLSPERDELAFIMLGRLHTPAARDWLLAASRNEHHKVRWNALIGLGELGDRSVYPRLEEAARSDVDHSVRLAAISAMGGVKAPESYDLLISLLGEQDPGLRMSAAWSLGELGDARAVPALQRAAGDQQERVRVEAASALRKLGSAPAAAEPAQSDPAGAPLSRLAGQPLSPDNPPPKDPRDLDVLTWRTPATRGERVVDYCPACRMRTVQDRFTVIVSHWYGLKVPFMPPGTEGKLGTRGEFSACAECSSLIPLDDDARHFVARYGQPFLRAEGWRGEAVG